MKLAIFGSRTLSDERIDKIIQDKIEQYKPEAIITSGETSGVNEIARNKAKENKITLVLEFANNEKFAKGKYYHRCLEILKKASFALFIHDGVSRGTKNELDICKKMNIPFEYIKLDLNDEADLINIDWISHEFNI